MQSIPGWVLSLIEWALGLALKKINPADVKKELSSLFKVLDAWMVGAEARNSGPLKGVADEVVNALHDCIAVITAALDA